MTKPKGVNTTQAWTACPDLECTSTVAESIYSSTNDPPQNNPRRNRVKSQPGLVVQNLPTSLPCNSTFTLCRRYVKYDEYAVGAAHRPLWSPLLVSLSQDLDHIIAQNELKCAWRLCAAQVIVIGQSEASIYLVTSAVRSSVLLRSILKSVSVGRKTEIRQTWLIFPPSVVSRCRRLLKAYATCVFLNQIFNIRGGKGVYNWHRSPTMFTVYNLVARYHPTTVTIIC